MAYVLTTRANPYSFYGSPVVYPGMYPGMWPGMYTGRYRLLGGLGQKKYPMPGAYGHYTYGPNPWSGYSIRPAYGVVPDVYESEIPGIWTNPFA